MSARNEAADMAMEWARRAEQWEQRRQARADSAREVSEGIRGNIEGYTVRQWEDRLSDAELAAETRDLAVTMATMWTRVATVQPDRHAGHCGSVIEGVDIGEGRERFQCVFREGHTGVHGYDSRTFGPGEHVVVWTDEGEGVHRLEDETRGEQP